MESPHANASSRNQTMIMSEELNGNEKTGEDALTSCNDEMIDDILRMNDDDFGKVYSLFGEKSREEANEVVKILEETFRMSNKDPKTSLPMPRTEFNMGEEDAKQFSETASENVFFQGRIPYWDDKTRHQIASQHLGSPYDVKQFHPSPRTPSPIPLVLENHAGRDILSVSMENDASAVQKLLTPNGDEEDMTMEDMEVPSPRCLDHRYNEKTGSRKDFDLPSFSPLLHYLPANTITGRNTGFLQNSEEDCM